ncbi:hypothetical protein SAMN05443575_1913 [Jatrophihabitans endophyticus]|uniref:Uncharacterized protein n=1 Tax=Jatrophihabitans endophyticus TaxID=1206085 RepID=A0A1M5IJ92_9ACTN|nr:hypothetical protein SAMN05443575_1913 [Jatrophihabitans endophyticus]
MEAIDSGSVTGVSVAVVVVLVVLGALLALLIARLVARVVIALVVVVLAIVVWQQRSHVEDEVAEHACRVDTTYFGIHVDPPDLARCRN